MCSLDKSFSARVAAQLRSESATMNKAEGLNSWLSTVYCTKWLYTDPHKKVVACDLNGKEWAFLKLHIPAMTGKYVRLLEER